MQLQLNDAQNSETSSAINHLKGVITDKDQIIDNLQQKMGSLMERLSDAEQRLFELQDVFTEDGKSARGSNLNDSFANNSDYRR